MAHIRTVVLGTAAPAEGHFVPSPWAPCTASGRRLAFLAGCAPSELERHFVLDNLYLGAAPPKGREGRDLLFEAGKTYDLRRPYRYILAGYEVVRALGWRAYPMRADRDTRGFLRWYVSREGVRMAVLPHPSGLNRWFNDVRNRERAARFMRNCLKQDRAWERMS